MFNDSIKEFLAKKAALANYFDEDQKEDIFDYIPPQKTNQIFTPRWVFGFGGDIRILEPENAVEKMLEMSGQMIAAENEVKKKEQ